MKSVQKAFKAAALLATVAFAFTASAVNYYWKGGEKEYGLWSALSNWSTASATGDEAEQLPGKDDAVSNGHAKFSLDGDYSIKSFDAYYKTYYFTNVVSETTATLTFAGSLGAGAYQRYYVYNGVTLLCPETSTLNLAGNDAQQHIFYVYNGGEIDVYGAASGRHSQFEIYAGGTMTFAPKSYSKTVDAGNRAIETFLVSGTLNLPNGIDCKYGAANKTNQVNFAANTAVVTLGGDVNSAVQGYKFMLNAGTLHVTGDSTFGDLASVVMDAGKSATIEVDEDKTLKVVQMAFGEGATLTKTGAGTLAFARLPDSVVVNGGVVWVGEDAESVTFGGGTVVMEASTEAGIPVVSSVAVQDGAKAKFDLRSLTRLADGDYTVVAAGSGLGADDYEFTLDPVVNARTTVKDDGSVVLTIDGIADDPNPFVWDPQDENAVWSADCAAWLNDGEHKAFENGHFAKFTGEEADYIGRIQVRGKVSPGKVVVSGDRDYVFAGDEIDTRTVLKSGTGTLLFDGPGFNGRTVELGGGTLAFGGQAKGFVATPVAMTVLNGAAGTVKGVATRSEGASMFTFRYGANSIAYDTATQFTTTNFTDSITCLAVASPKAPDGTSLSGKSLWVSGWFKVEASDAGNWTFKGVYDDNIMLVVDGTQLFKTTSYQDEKTATANLESGWHSFDIRAQDGSGGWGNANFVRAQKPGGTLQKFTEEYFTMDWRGSEIDPAVAPETIAVQLVLGAGSSLTLGSDGVVFTEGSLIDSTASLSIDIHGVPANRTFLRCEDKYVLAVAKAKIVESLGSLGEIVDTEDGIAWKMNAVFESDTITDLNDPDGWLIGVTPGADEHVTIIGAGTHPVVTEDTIGFAEMKLADGADLTIAAERSVNALTLEAGTQLDVDVSVQHPNTFTRSGYIPKREILFCTDDTDRTLADFTFSATMGGTSWTDKFKPSDVALAKENGDGSVTVQFQRGDDVYTKVVYVKFTKRGTDIYAEGIKACYVNGKSKVGTDMDTITVNSSNYADSDGSGGYGVKDVVLRTDKDVTTMGGTVTATGAFTTTGEGSVAVAVTEDNVLDLSGVTVTTGAKLVKTGLGAIVFGATAPTNVKISEGIVAFQPEVEYDLSGITIEEDAVVKVATAQGLRPAAPVTDETTGKTTFYGPGFYVGVGGWNDDANWVSGKPGAEDVVHVAGEGSELTVDDAAATMPAGIEVRDGAALKVLADVTLPQVTLAPTAAFAIGDNAASYAVTLSEPPVGSFALTDDRVVLPAFYVATNVTLTVPGKTFFKNLDMTICGKVTTPEANCGMIRFGYAAANETSYIALNVDKGEIRPLVNQSNDGGAIGVLYPEDGGRVIPVGDIVFRNTTFNPCGSWTEWRNLYFCINNPANVDCDIVFDNAMLQCTWGVNVGGASHLRFRNKASVWFNAACINHGAGNFTVKDAATLEFEDASTSFEFAQSNSGLNMQPAADGFEQLFFRNGARLIQHAITGNSKAVVTFDDGMMTVPNNYRQRDLLTGAKAAHVPAGKWLTVRGEKTSQGSDWDRVVKFTDAPITGEGSLMVTNTAAGKLMDVTIVNGANTATGLALAAAEEGTMLRFADGANWAGTVVANGHVALTNLTDGAAATTVTFGNLRLQSGEFPIRVFRGEGGALTSDAVNLTGAVVKGEGDTGFIRLTGAEFTRDDKLFLGTAPAGAWKDAVIMTASGLPLKIVESKPDEHGLVTVTGKIPTGFCITIQ